MPAPIETISESLFNFLKDRFDVSSVVDEKGKFVDDPAKIKVFSFDFTNTKGKSVGSVVISLLDDSWSKDSIKIYYGQDISSTDPKTQKEWYEFLKEMRRFAKTHLLGFDVRNINKSTLTKRDIEPMFESTFGPIDGSVRTSRQPLNNIEIIIKHSSKIDPFIKNSRSRKIQKIYLSNQSGEKFLLPFNSLMAARAMARHIDAGGNPYDENGKNLCKLVDEMQTLRSFVRSVKYLDLNNRREKYAVEAAIQRFLEIKKLLKRLITKRGYSTLIQDVATCCSPIEDGCEDDLFTNIELNDFQRNALPYVAKAFMNYGKTPEEEEFETWAKATQGLDGKEQLQDVKKVSTESLNLTQRKLIKNIYNKKKKKNIKALYRDLAYNNKLKTPDPTDPFLEPFLDLNEADVPSSAGVGSPLTYPYVKVPNHFHSKKEIRRLKNTSGKMSPLSLLNSKEKDDANEEGEE